MSAFALLSDKTQSTLAVEAANEKNLCTVRIALHMESCY